jgi:hypothetical protein
MKYFNHLNAKSNWIIYKDSVCTSQGTLCQIQNRSINICRERVTYIVKIAENIQVLEKMMEIILQLMVSTFTTNFESKPKTIPNML